MRLHLVRQNLLRLIPITHFFRKAGPFGLFLSQFFAWEQTLAHAETPQRKALILQRAQQAKLSN
jgi:hypothetical protein